MNKLITIMLLAVVATACTDNYMAKNFGGSETVQVPKGEKLLNVTWKGEKGASNLWLMTRKMRPNEKADTIYFREKSGYGVLEGTVIFIESKGDTTTAQFNMNK